MPPLRIKGLGPLFPRGARTNFERKIKIKNKLIEKDVFIKIIVIKQHKQKQKNGYAITIQNYSLLLFS